MPLLDDSFGGCPDFRKNVHRLGAGCSGGLRRRGDAAKSPTGIIATEPGSFPVFGREMGELPKAVHKVVHGTAALAALSDNGGDAHVKISLSCTRPSLVLSARSRGLRQ